MLDSLDSLSCSRKGAGKTFYRSLPSSKTTKQSETTPNNQPSRFGSTPWTALDMAKLESSWIRPGLSRMNSVPAPGRRRSSSYTTMDTWGFCATSSALALNPPTPFCCTLKRRYAAFVVTSFPSFSKDWSNRQTAASLLICRRYTVSFAFVARSKRSSPSQPSFTQLCAPFAPTMQLPFWARSLPVA